MSSRTHTAYRLTESSVMLAFAAVLSVLKIVDMPYGGSITACSMLPLLVIAYRYGFKWGLLTSFTYGLVQALLGMENFSYAPGFTSMVTLLLFDYLIAFLVLGLGALFRKSGRSQTVALALAAIVTGLLRYLCHTVSGFTVWRDLSVPFTESLIYSFSYNATYMIPETVILTLGAVYVSRVLSFEGATVTRAEKSTHASPAATVLSVLAKTTLLVSAVWAIVLIAPAMQSADSGSLFLAGLATVNWAFVGIVLGIGILLFAVLSLIAKRFKTT